ncbi:D-glycero-alpha-D-manno-heptose-1,7-bisphosphate 7-phosphatase [Streptomyces sp. NPDC088812]|uniref:D-glycero-alpha-D-manno-heptose-1,7-bisphosphate 7-phosphatase n=1 Tax=Streptomyces sp. NPDC088812 TaxID=3365905 RepID=UPI003811F399
MNRPLLFLPGPNPPTTAPRGLLLCDRDGTVIENRDSYVLSSSDVRFLPGAAAALGRAAADGLAVLLVSNQSPVGRGLLTEGDCVRLHEQIVSTLVAAGVPVAGSWLCPHTPQAGCGCRKPAPGMARAAQHRFGVPPDRCFFVGDSAEDMGAAVASGCRPFLVRTGRGAAHEPLVRSRPDLRDVQVVDDLAAAVAATEPARASHWTERA